jgi:protoporphyrinogen oxidase
MPKKAIIIGAGPAGLTAAYELLKRTDIVPIILEKSGDIGGISKTVNYKGNRIDIGGHRFFSKSDRVMNWWMKIMPVQPLSDSEVTLTYQRRSRTIGATEPMPKMSEKELSDNMMLVRNRLSRIYFLKKFFSYPIQLSLDTLGKLGLWRTIAILLSYIKAQLLPRKPEKSLEDFFISRFGSRLYRLFFKDYTEKVWGVPCAKISAEWGAQRIKGISIGKALAHAARSLTKNSGKKQDIGQKSTETSLIEKFLYPKFGPGQLWEEVARQVQEMGGTLHMNYDVTRILTDRQQVTSVEAVNRLTGESSSFEGDYFFSTMPVQELIAGMNGTVPPNVQEVAAGLLYRDFITVGVLLKKMPEPGKKLSAQSGTILPDTWIYIQERDVKVGRLQIFNNWSPFMVKDENTVWIGMEYFCNKGDEFWSRTDEEIQTIAIRELETMGLSTAGDVLDATALRMEKTYPAYFGSYSRFEEIRQFADRYENLFLVGRNGMHKYNNSDHSMLTAMVAVDNITAGETSKENIWAINTEMEYHEEKSELQEKDAPNPAIALPPQHGSFKDFLFNSRQNRVYLIISAAAVLLQFAIFKFFYPFASYIIGDSWVYLYAAHWNPSINVYPTGYPKFLRLFSVFSRSDTALVGFQYVFLESATLLLTMTINYFYRPTKFTKNLLYVFAIFNPIYLYLSNMVSSDAYFVALSIGWFTLLIWIIERPNIKLILLQIAVVFLAFITRYNAVYYPVISAFAIILSRLKIPWKVTGITASFLVIALFVWYTSQEYYNQIGIRQFTPFSGWQMANNALYAYRYVDSADRKPVPKKFQEIDRMARHYFDTTKNIMKYPQELQFANTYYMWKAPSPLQQYGMKKYKLDSSREIGFKYWASLGPLYNAYGTWLIRQYPSKYFQYYLFPNFAKYYAPPVEFLDSYNMGNDTVSNWAKDWFQYKTKKVFTRTKDLKINTLNFYPFFIGTLNVVFLISLLFFILLKGFQLDKAIVKLLQLGALFWLANFCFSIFASPIALRFQIFPTLVLFAASSLMIEYICTMAFTTPQLSPNNLATIKEHQ